MYINLCSTLFVPNYRVIVIVFNATFNTISVILWRSVLLVEKIDGPGENHRPAASHFTDQIYHIMMYTSPWASSFKNTFNLSKITSPMCNFSSLFFFGTASVCVWGGGGNWYEIYLYLYWYWFLWTLSLFEQCRTCSQEYHSLPFLVSHDLSKNFNKHVVGHMHTIL